MRGKSREGEKCNESLSEGDLKNHPASVRERTFSVASSPRSPAAIAISSVIFDIFPKRAHTSTNTSTRVR